MVEDHFSQIEHVKANESELLNEIKKVETLIGMELKEQKRTQIWLSTKHKNELKKFNVSSSRLLLSNSLRHSRQMTTLPAFYKLLLNSSLEGIRELYRREMKANSKDFVYENEKQKKVYKAATHTGPLKGVNRKELHANY